MHRKTSLPGGSSAKVPPLWYRITVSGLIPTSWVDRLGGLNVTEASRGRSTLEGPIADSAAMAGVLDTLCQLGLQILEVVALSEKRGNER